MKALRLFAVLLLASASASAFAWPSCSGNWVQVPAGTSSANGAIYTTGDHLTFQCTKPSDPKQPQGNPIQNTLTNTSNSNSSAGASSTSSSGASATGGDATATGGNSNQKQGQSQSSENNNQSSATNSGNNSSYSNVTNIAAPKIPVASAYAPSAYPSAPCVKGFGAGVQTMAVGGTFGGSKVDDGCDARETARAYALLGSRLSACKILVAQKKSKKAGVTLDDCMYQEPAQEPNVTAAIAPPVAPRVEPVTVTINVPQPQVVVLHDEITVKATPAQVKAAQTVKPVIKKRTTKNCIVPPSLTQPMPQQK